MRLIHCLAVAAVTITAGSLSASSSDNVDDKQDRISALRKEKQALIQEAHESGYLNDPLFQSLLFGLEAEIIKPEIDRDRERFRNARGAKKSQPIVQVGWLVVKEMRSEIQIDQMYKKELVGSQSKFFLDLFSKEDFEKNDVLKKLVRDRLAWRNEDQDLAEELMLAVNDNDSDRQKSLRSELRGRETARADKLDTALRGALSVAEQSKMVSETLAKFGVGALVMPAVQKHFDLTDGDIQKFESQMLARQRVVQKTLTVKLKHGIRPPSSRRSHEQYVINVLKHTNIRAARSVFEADKRIAAGEPIAAAVESFMPSVQDTATKLIEWLEVKTE